MINILIEEEDNIRYPMRVRLTDERKDEIRFENNWFTAFTLEEGLEIAIALAQFCIPRLVA